MWQGLMLNRGVQHFLQDVRWGDDLDYLLIDMPPGTGDVQMGVAKLLPRGRGHRGDHAGPGRPRWPSGRWAWPQELPAVAGVVENMSAFQCEHGGTYALFGEGGGEQLAHDAGVPLLGAVPLEPSVSAGGDTGACRWRPARARRRGVPGHRRSHQGGGGPAGGHGRLQRPHAGCRRRRPRYRGAARAEAARTT